MDSSIREKALAYFRQLKEKEGRAVFLEKGFAGLSIQGDIPDEKSNNPEPKPEFKEIANIRPQTEQSELITGKDNVAAEWRESSSLNQLYDNIHKCTSCPLGLTRTNFVFGVGNPKADILVIGEAPGADEDAKGEPFVGRAGQLLNKILEAIGFRREDVYIANIIKCRPPGNRRPEKSESDECEPYLIKQIELIKPAFILALGLTAVDTLLKKRHRMSDMRGKMLDYHSAKMLVTYHPAALLRNPNWKKPAWEDVKLLRRLYDEYLQNSRH